MIKRKTNKKDYTFVYLLILFLIYFFYKIVDDSIVYEGYNYISIFLIILGFLFFVFFLWKIKYFKQSLFYEKFIVSLFFAYLFSVIFMIPVNYYNRYFFCKNLSSIHGKYKLVNITKRRTSRGFNFEFKNEMVFVRGFRPIFNSIEKDNDIENYRVEVTYKKGLLNSNVILKTNIVRSPNLAH